MIDEEKVIKDLILLSDKENDYSYEGLTCCDVANEALAMIREQRKQIGMLNMRNNPLSPCSRTYKNWDGTVKHEVCCMCKVPVNRGWNYCPNCGQKVNWE